MQFVESRRGRRIVAHLERGSNLLDSVHRLLRQCGVGFAELRATGSLDAVALTTFDRQARAWRPARALSGEIELIQLSGSAALDGAGTHAIQLRASVLQESEFGPQMVAGVITRAVVFDLELIVDSLDDIEIRREASSILGMTSWSQMRSLRAEPEVTPTVAPAPAPVPAVAPAPAPVPAVEPTWSDVVEASARAETVPAEMPPKLAPGTGPVVASPRIAPGDLIDHPRFRRCTVHRIEGDYEFLHVALRNGRVVRLSMDVIELRPAGTENGQRVFTATIT